MNRNLNFHGHAFHEVEHKGQPCVTLAEVAVVLYDKGTPQTAGAFENATKRLNELYRRHADEFTESMTALVQMQTAGGSQAVRVFSLRGCHLLAMFARTPVAKEFRRWALDIIERRTKEADEVLPQLYTALADLAGEKAVASIHGKGLYRWRQVKPEKVARVDCLLAVIQPNLFPH